jgi:hypothetical protein
MYEGASIISNFFRELYPGYPLIKGRVWEGEGRGERGRQGEGNGKVVKE